MEIENLSKSSQGTEFEYHVSKVLEGLGIFNHITVTPHSNDGGIDISMDGTTPFGDIIKCGVECKDQDIVGRPIIQKLHSALQMNIKYDGNKYGYVITSGRFTSGAVDYANYINAESASLKIYLINGRELRKLEFLNENRDKGFRMSGEDCKGFDSFISSKYDKGTTPANVKSIKTGSWGSSEGHFLVALLTIWWTCGIGNLLYALYVHLPSESKLQIRETLTKKRVMGSIVGHLFIFFLTIWWTYGIGNLLYALFVYWMSKRKLQVSAYNLDKTTETSRIYDAKDFTISEEEKTEDSYIIENFGHT